MTLSPWTAKLREWQARAVSEVLTHTGSDFLATATPAAGKLASLCGSRISTWPTEWLAGYWFICPTDHLRTQWADAAGLVGIHLDPALTNEQAVEAHDYHGAVVTYQQVFLRRPSFSVPAGAGPPY